MTEIKQTRPILSKSAFTKEQDKAYSRTFRNTACEACGVNDGTVVGAHINMGKGGTALKAWGAQVGLCAFHHDVIDRRIQNKDAIRTWILEKLVQKLAMDRAGKWKDNQ